jgi:molybdate transport system substrate-binding protein
MRTKIAVLAAILAATGVAGCSSSTHHAASTTSPLSGSITVFAASSLTGAFTQLGTSFQAAHPGTTVHFSFGSSGDLATQIDQGAPADVFASAAPKNMQTVITAGNAASSTTFVTNTLEIAVAPGNPKGVTGLADLTKPGLKLATCVATAPCGALAQTVLTGAGVHASPTASEPDVKSTLAVLESGEVDAALVYVTDVKSAGTKVTGVPIPAAQNGTTAYPIAALSHAQNATVAAAFVSYVTSPDGLRVLEAAGFGAP